MYIGELRHKIEIQERTLSQDATGHETSAYATLCTPWAKVEELGGVENAGTVNQKVSELTTRFTIRYRSDLLPTMNIVYKDVDYAISSIIDPDGKRVYLQINTTVRETQDDS